MNNYKPASLTALKNTLNIEDVYRKQNPSAKQ